jgi:hypothetical protein
MEFISTVALRQPPGNVQQRRCTCRINQRPEIGIGLFPRLGPEPQSGEQYRSMFNEGVGGVHNEVVRRVRRRRPDVRPDLLLRLLSELKESAHALAVRP